MNITIYHLIRQTRCDGCSELTEREFTMFFGPRAVLIVLCHACADELATNLTGATLAITPKPKEHRPCTACRGEYCQACGSWDCPKAAAWQEKQETPNPEPK